MDQRLECILGLQHSHVEASFLKTGVRLQREAQPEHCHAVVREGFNTKELSSVLWVRSIMSAAMAAVFSQCPATKHISIMWGSQCGPRMGDRFRGSVVRQNYHHKRLSAGFDLTVRSADWFAFAVREEVPCLLSLRKCILLKSKNAMSFNALWRMVESSGRIWMLLSMSMLSDLSCIWASPI